MIFLQSFFLCDYLGFHFFICQTFLCDIRSLFVRKTDKISLYKIDVRTETDKIKTNISLVVLLLLPGHH